MNVGDRLKLYRKYYGLTQLEFALKAEVNRTLYGEIERNETNPTVLRIEKICDVLKIDIAELFLFEVNKKKDHSFVLNPKLINIVFKCNKENIDVHFNRSMLFDNCYNSLWYCGYIGSMSFDEFELQIYSEGNIKGRLYLDYCEILNVNSQNISNELRKYVTDDDYLDTLIEYSPFSEEILEKKGGNGFFVSECNWLTARLVNNQSKKIIDDAVVLDSTNILDIFRDITSFFDYIFAEYNEK